VAGERVANHKPGEAAATTFMSSRG